MALTLADFDLLRRVGDGAYSHVVLARHKATEKEYALKIIDKRHVLRHNAVEAIKRERAILDSLNDEGVAKLYFTFQDALSLYLGLEYCPGGELYDQILVRGRLDVETVRFYSAEIILTLEVLRKKGIVHRDLKPENMLLSSTGHLKLIDFGSAKLLSMDVDSDPIAFSDVSAGNKRDTPLDRPSPAVISTGSPRTAPVIQRPEITRVDGGGGDAMHPTFDSTPSMQSSNAHIACKTSADLMAGEHLAVHRPSEESACRSIEDDGPAPESSVKTKHIGPSLSQKRRRTASLVGTADYVSPEVLENADVGFAADLWALGCVIYQMLVGKPPFKTASEYLTFQKILVRDFAPLPKELPNEVQDLVDKLLVRDPMARIGASDIKDLKMHPFFNGIDWDRLREQSAPVPAVIETDSIGSAASSFDWELASLAAAIPKLTSERHVDDINLEIDD